MSMTIRALLILGLVIANSLAFGFETESSVRGQLIQTSLPAVHVDPLSTTDPSLVPGENFTIEVKISNVTELQGLDIQLNWNTSILNYTSHLVKIPVEDYPDGVLHEPAIELADQVNEAAGTYWTAFTTLGGPSFNGSGTVFEITFTVVGFGECILDIFNSDLANYQGKPISHRVEDGYFSNVFYDVIITNVVPSSAAAFIGDIIEITVVVLNNGTARNENFNVTTYFDDEVIDTIAVSMLPPSEEETLTFYWNTTGIIPGNYTITANATTVPGESHVENNEFTDGVVTLAIQPIHDVAVTALSPLKTLVFSGYCFHVNATLENQGLFAETFNVTVCANLTLIGELQVALNPGDNQTLVFPWNSEGTPYGMYIITATADQVSGENDTGDNTLIYVSVNVMHLGDFDMDRDMDIYDVVLLVGVYGSAKGDPKYNPNFDVNCDGRIDIYDVVMVTPFYGYRES